MAVVVVVALCATPSFLPFCCRTGPSNALCFELMFDSLLFPVPFLPARGVGFGGAVKVFFVNSRAFLSPCARG